MMCLSTLLGHFRLSRDKVTRDSALLAAGSLGITEWKRKCKRLL